MLQYFGRILYYSVERYEKRFSVFRVQNNPTVLAMLVRNFPVIL